MISTPCKKSGLRDFVITANELRQLLFWAEHGIKELGRGGGGSYYPEVVSTIKECKVRLATKSPQYDLTHRQN